MAHAAACPTAYGGGARLEYTGNKVNWVPEDGYIEENRQKLVEKRLGRKPRAQIRPSISFIHESSKPAGHALRQFPHTETQSYVPGQSVSSRDSFASSSHPQAALLQAERLTSKPELQQESAPVASTSYSISASRSEPASSSLVEESQTTHAEPGSPPPILTTPPLEGEQSWVVDYLCATFNKVQTIDFSVAKIEIDFKCDRQDVLTKV